jgi:hypothetical protein
VTRTCARPHYTSHFRELRFGCFGRGARRSGTKSFSDNALPKKRAMAGSTMTYAASTFTGATSRRDFRVPTRKQRLSSACTLTSAKGKGSKYRNDVADPYQGKIKSKEKREKAAPAPSAERGPINHAFVPGEDTEEYFLFTRKVRRDGSEGSLGDTGNDTGDTKKKSDENSLVAAALGMKAEDVVTKVASLGTWLPLGDISIEKGGDLDTVVAERTTILASFAKKKHLKLLPMLKDEKLEWGVRVQRGPPRGKDNTAVYPVATFELNDFKWDPVLYGDFGTVKAELRLMQAMPALGKGKKNEMLTSAMDLIKAQQEKAAEAKAARDAGEE